MKKLLLMRHAKSDWSTPGQQDFDRPLNARGRNAAPLMGKFLHQTGNIPDFILASPAKRVVETIDGMASSWETGAEVDYLSDMYSGNSGSYIEAIRKISEQAETLMLTGHNPTVEETALKICTQNRVSQFFSFPTAAIACFEMPDIAWKRVQPESGTLKWFVTPKLLKHL